MIQNIKDTFTLSNGVKNAGLVRIAAVCVLIRTVHSRKEDVMNILLLGSAGSTGKALTEKIIKEIPDAKLTLFSRSAGKLKINSTTWTMSLHRCQTARLQT